MPGLRWTVDDFAFMRRHVGRLPFARIGRKLGRTAVAVEEQIKRVGLGSATRATGGMGSPEISAALGIARSTVERWLASGFLPASRITLRKRTVWRVTRADLIAFILRGGLIGVSSMPTASYRAAAQEGARLWHDRMIDDRTLAGMLGCTRAHLHYLRRVKGFPTPARAGKDGQPAWYRRADVRAWLDRNVAYMTPAIQRGLSA